MTHPVENIMKTTMEQLKAMADVNTIVGNPILTAGETMILPVSKLSMGFISGGGEYGPEKRRTPIQKSAEEMDECGCYPFAGAAVAGMTITPLAFLSVNNGCVKVMPADYDTTFGGLSKVCCALRRYLVQWAQPKQWHWMCPPEAPY